MAHLTDRTLQRSDTLRFPWRFSWAQFLSIGIVPFLLLPIIYLIVRAAGVGEDGLAYLLRPRTLQIAGNSLLLMVTVTLSAGVLGTVWAWLTTRTDLPFARFWLIVGLLTMVIPSYLGATTYLSMFGEQGILQSWLEPLGVERLPDIRGFFGAWFTLTLFTYPYVVLTMRAAFLNTDRALDEAGRSLGLAQHEVFRRITLPQLRPALTAGMTLVALYTLSDFGAVATMRFNAFTRAIYLQYTSSFDRERAALLAIMLIAMVLGLLFIERIFRSNQQPNYRAGTGAKRILKKTPLGRWRYPALAFCSVTILIGVVVPLATMVFWLTTRVYIDAVPVDMAELLQNTVSVSVLAALVTTACAIPIAIIAERRPNTINHWIVRLAHVGYVLPGIVIGLSLVFFATQATPSIYQTQIILVLGYTIHFIPLSIGVTRAVLTQINPNLLESARSLGIPKWRSYWRVMLPLARTGILAGSALVFLNVMKELPITLILRPIGFRTLSIRIWESYEEAMLVLIGQPGIWLIFISALALVVILWRDRQENT